MAYQIYTPVQGPVIPASIFSSAAERGARMGKLIDSPETARLKGEILGKEKALDLQMKRENIESANINQEAAKVRIERQEEALEADKRANELAPIKEGLNIAGGVLGVIGGIQNIMSNSNVLTQQEQRIELNEIKLNTENNINEIKNRSALNTAKVADANAQRELALMRTQDTVTEAISKNDKAGLEQVINSSEFHLLSNENADHAAATLTTAHNMGVLSKDQLDARLASIYSKKTYDEELKTERALAQVKQKNAAEFNKNLGELVPVIQPFLTIHDVPITKETLKDIEIVSSSTYALDEDDNTKVDRNKAVEGIPSTAGPHYVLHGDKIIGEIDENGTKYQQKLNLLKIQARDNDDLIQQDLDKAGLMQVNTPQGKRTVRKTEQPSNQNMEIINLDGVKRRLGERGVPAARVDETVQRGKEVGKTIREGGWWTGTKEGIKRAVNRIAPSAIDNISDKDLETADTAAKALAAADLAAYNKASPKAKKAMARNLKNKAGRGIMAHYDVDSAEDYYFKGETPTSHGVQTVMANQKRGKKQVAEDRLTEIYKDEITSELEKARTAGIALGKEDKAPTPEERENLLKNQGMDAAASATTAAEAAKIQEQYEQKRAGKEGASFQRTSLSPGEKESGASQHEIGRVADTLQTAYNWSKGKRNRIEVKVNRVETNPYLQNEIPEVKAVASVESEVTMEDVSWSRDRNIVGLMQVGRAAEQDVRRILGDNTLDRSIPEDNVLIGKTYLQYLASIDKFNNNKVLIYAAYNGGMGTIFDAIKLAGGDTSWEAVSGKLYEVLESQYKAAVEKRGKDKVGWTPFEKFNEITSYPFKVLEYEEFFNQLLTQQGTPGRQLA